MAILIPLFDSIDLNFMGIRKLITNRLRRNVSRNPPIFLYRSCSSACTACSGWRCPIPAPPAQGIITLNPQSTHIYRVPQCMSLRRNWDSPTPSLASEYATPPEPKGGGEAYSPAGGGVGESQFRRLEKKLSTLPTLCLNPRKRTSKRAWWVATLLVYFVFFDADIHNNIQTTHSSISISWGLSPFSSLLNAHVLSRETPPWMRSRELNSNLPAHSQMSYAAPCSFQSRLCIWKNEW